MLFGFNLGVMGKAAAASYRALARIFYSSEMYTDSSMTNYLKNTGYTTQRENALAYASNHIYHDGVTHSTPCGIVHTLAADSKKLATSVDAGWVDNLDNTYTGTAVTGDIVGISTDTSGVVKVAITLSSVTGGDVNGYTADGTYVFEETLTASLNLTGTGFTGIVTVVSIEAITLPTASYFHYYDTASKSIKQLSSTVDYGLGLLPVSTTYPLTSSYQYAIAATAPLTAADTAYIDSNPEAMYRVLYDSLVLPSGFSSTDITHFYDGTGGLKSSFEKQVVQDIATPLGSLNADAITFGYSTDGTNNTVSILGNVFTVHNESVTSTSNRPQCYIQMPSNSDDKYNVVIKITCTSGQLKIANIWSRTLYFPLDILNAGEYITYSFTNTMVLWGGSPTNERFAIGLDGINYPIFDATIEIETYKNNSYSEIANYTSNVRTNFLNTTYGATNLKLVKDASGRTTGVAPAGVTIWDSDSRQAVTNWTITAPFTVTEVLDGVTYTWTSDGNKYIAGVPSGTYTLPTGTWTLNDTGFDDLTAVTQRGTTKLETSVIIP